MSAKSELERAARLASRAIYIGDYEAIAVVLGRFQMFLSTKDRGIFPHLALTGFWESWVTLAMMAMVKPGMRVVNVGANVGYYALLFADLVGPTGSVMAFEPNPELAELIQRSATLNGYGHLTVREVAVSNWLGRNGFVIPEGHAMNAHLQGAPGTPGIDHTVEVTTLDRGLDFWGAAPPHLVFIDAEGAEEGIWEGMTLAREAKATIVMEYSPKRYADPLVFAKRFVADGYSLGFIHESGAVMATTQEDLAAGPEVMAVLMSHALVTGLPPGMRARTL